MNLRETEDVYVLLGGNDGLNTLSVFDKVKAELQHISDATIMVSSVYESPPWGYDSAKAYYNQVVVLRSNSSPNILLKQLLFIEAKNGRARSTKGLGYEDRTIDIDLLYVGSQITQEDCLDLPHPRLHLRRFTLAPLVEVAPNFRHPVFNKTQKELLATCKDSSTVKKYNAED